MPIDTSKNPLNTSTSSIRGEYMTQDEAIRYATKMGMTDSIRGLQQMYGQITNSEDLLDKLNSFTKNFRTRQIKI